MVSAVLAGDTEQHTQSTSISDLDLSCLELGCLQHFDELQVIYRVSFRSAKPIQDLVFYLLQLLTHLSIANNELVSSFF